MLVQMLVNQLWVGHNEIINLKLLHSFSVEEEDDGIVDDEEEEDEEQEDEEEVNEDDNNNVENGNENE